MPRRPGGAAHATTVRRRRSPSGEPLAPRVQGARASNPTTPSLIAIDRSPWLLPLCERGQPIANPSGFEMFPHVSPSRETGRTASAWVRPSRHFRARRDRAPMALRYGTHAVSSRSARKSSNLISRSPLIPPLQQHRRPSSVQAAPANDSRTVNGARFRSLRRAANPGVPFRGTGDDAHPSNSFAARTIARAIAGAPCP
jgi:hypothetical protein